MMMEAWGEGELARSRLSLKTTVASLRKCLWRVFHSGFGRLLFVFGELAFSFHLAWQNFNTSAFHLNKSSVSGSRFYDGMTFSTCRKAVPFHAFRGSA